MSGTRLSPSRYADANTNWSGPTELSLRGRLGDMESRFGYRGGDHASSSASLSRRLDVLPGEGRMHRDDYQDQRSRFSHHEPMTGYTSSRRHLDTLSQYDVDFGQRNHHRSRLSTSSSVRSHQPVSTMLSSGGVEQLPPPRVPPELRQAARANTISHPTSIGSRSLVSSSRRSRLSDPAESLRYLEQRHERERHARLAPPTVQSGYRGLGVDMRRDNDERFGFGSRSDPNHDLGMDFPTMPGTIDDVPNTGPARPTARNTGSGAFTFAPRYFRN